MAPSSRSPQVAFAHAAQAVEFCLAVQTALLHVDWPEELLQLPHTQEVRDGRQLLWRGLRVRMAVHCGVPVQERNPLTGGVEYYGAVLEELAAVERCTRGGFIGLSEAVSRQVGTPENATLVPPSHDLLDRRVSCVLPLPLAKRKHLDQPEQLPRQLSGTAAR